MHRRACQMALPDSFPTSRHAKMAGAATRNDSAHRAAPQVTAHAGCLARTEATPGDVFQPGSPEEDHVRRHSSYVADGAADWVRALDTLLCGVLANSCAAGRDGDRRGGLMYLFYRYTMSSTYGAWHHWPVPTLLRSSYAVMKPGLSWRRRGSRWRYTIRVKDGNEGFDGFSVNIIVVTARIDLPKAVLAVLAPQQPCDFRPRLMTIGHHRDSSLDASREAHSLRAEGSP
jgi:hypothetical protein